LHKKIKGKNLIKGNWLYSSSKGGFLLGYSHTNSRNQKYFLHNREKLFFFSKKEEGCVDLPAGFQVVENHKTGLPMVKRK